jgi:trigger factor
MKIDFNRSDDLNARMTLVIEYADYGPKLDENIKKYSKKLAIKGFRSGKTPKSVLTKMYGKGMLEETVNGLLNEKLFGYLDEHKIGFFGSPMMADDAEPIDFDAKSQADYTFVFDLGLKPIFELEYKLDKPLDVMVPTIDQAAMDEEIIRYRRVFGEEVPVAGGKVEKHDRVGVRLNRILEGGAVEEAGEDTVLDLDRVKGEASDMLIDLTEGATLEVDLEKFLGAARDIIIKNTLHLEEDPAPGSPLQYKLTITSINRPQHTPLTGEQLTKFTGKQMEDEAEFRTFLEKRETENLETQATDMKKMVVRKALIEANPFEIPEGFLFKWVNQQREKQIEAGSREARHLFRDAKWSLLLTRISEGEGLEVTEKDVQRQVTNWIVQNVNYMQTDIKKLMDQLYSNEYFMSSMKENALEDVVFRHILPKYQFVEKEISMDQFEKEFHDLHHELFDHGDHDHHHDHEHSHSHSEHSHG